MLSTPPLAPQSRFVFVSEEIAPLQFSWVLRLPPGPGERSGIVSINLNGAPLCESPVTDCWVQGCVLAPSTVVRDGVTELVIQWPDELVREVDFQHLGPFFLIHGYDHVQYHRQFGQIFDLTVGANETSP
jgi:hypothetical protein